MQARGFETAENEKARVPRLYVGRNDSRRCEGKSRNLVRGSQRRNAVEYEKKNGYKQTERLKMANVKQIQAIHVLKRKLNLDEETYRQMLTNYGATSSKHLSERKAKDLISKLNVIAKAISPDYRRGRATDRQIFKIKAMWQERARNKSMKSLDKFIKHTTGIDHIEWLTVPDATKVINGLKKIKKADESA